MKIGLLAAALARLGSAPETRADRYDLQTTAAWSSNPAANRLLRRIGGSQSAGAALAQQALARLGATSSTYTGDYIVGTQLQPGAPAGQIPTQPPPISGRVTTARDMARALYSIQAAAVGRPGARRQTGLSPHAARLALGYLLASEPSRTTSASSARPCLRACRSPRSTAGSRACATRPRSSTRPPDPWIAVALTYADGLSRREAAGLGRRLAALIPTR